MCIGSTAHFIRRDDIVCGIGSRGNEIPPPSKAPCTILGLRGPVSMQHFKEAGHDVSNVRFLMDPGLAIRFMIEDSIGPERERAIFIPHYRERNRYRLHLPRGIEFVDIDNSPMRVAYEILRSTLVYTSSLHGLVFAHALHRPCVLIAPEHESLTKYIDHVASVGLRWRRPADNIFDAIAQPKPTSSEPVDYCLADFAFPSALELRDHGVLN